MPRKKSLEGIVKALAKEFLRSGNPKKALKKAEEFSKGEEKRRERIRKKNLRERKTLKRGMSERKINQEINKLESIVKSKRTTFQQGLITDLKIKKGSIKKRRKRSDNRMRHSREIIKSISSKKNQKGISKYLGNEYKKQLGVLQLYQKGKKIYRKGIGTGYSLKKALSKTKADIVLKEHIRLLLIDFVMKVREQIKLNLKKHFRGNYTDIYSYNFEYKTGAKDKLTIRANPHGNRSFPVGLAFEFGTGIHGKKKYRVRKNYIQSRDGKLLVFKKRRKRLINRPSDRIPGNITFTIGNLVFTKYTRGIEGKRIVSSAIRTVLMTYDSSLRTIIRKNLDINDLKKQGSDEPKEKTNIVSAKKKTQKRIKQRAAVAKKKSVVREVKEHKDKDIYEDDDEDDKDLHVTGSESALLGSIRGGRRDEETFTDEPEEDFTVEDFGLTDEEDE